jgi:membrane protein implicated in regulation of membrane protease activity
MAKKHDRPSLRIILKYILLQLPGQVSFVFIVLLLRQWLEAPVYLAWGLLAFWVGKDLAFFPFLWRFYDPNQYPDRFRMVGRKGVALSRLNPDGYVRVRGERWQAGTAEGQDPVEPGEAIGVVAVDRLKLTVKRCTEDKPPVGK